MNGKDLLLSEETMKVAFSPELAKLIGLNECLFLSQLQYWISQKEKSGDLKTFKDERMWVYNTYEQWREQFPYWSKNTLIRTIASCEKAGYILSSNFNSKGFDKTKWYTIDYERLSHVGEPPTQNGFIHLPKMGKASTQNGQTNTIDYYKDNNKEDLNVNGASSGEPSYALDGNAASAPQGMPTRAPQGDVDSIIKKQVDRYFEGYRDNDDTKDEVFKIVNYFYGKYQEVFGCPHPIMTQNTMDNVVASIIMGTDLVQDVDFKIYKELIDSYFELDMPNCDYHITHFVSGHVRDYRWYDCGFGGLLEEYRYGM